MKQRSILLCLLVGFLLLSLACSTITGFNRNTNEARETAASFATRAVELVTQGAPLVETAEAIGTEIPDLKATAETVLTENPEIVETVQAIATEGLDIGKAPADIPVVDEATITNFYGSDSAVSYTTTQDYQTVVDFYKNEMPANGWEGDPSMSFELKSIATLTWNQVDRQATVIITVNPVDNSSVVAITIQNR